MRGGYDLHGRYYPNVEDAISQRIKELEARQYQQQQEPQEIYYLRMKIEDLENRIAQLESKLLNP